MHTNEQKKLPHPTPPPQVLAQQRQSARIQPDRIDQNPGFANLSIIPPEAQSEKEALALAGQQTTVATPAAQTPQLVPGFQQQLRPSLSQGNKIPEATRRQMEQHLGADFSRVRIHTDERAKALSESIQANAFTLGEDIFFNHGAFAPNTGTGKKRLAHELVHTQQQSTSGSSPAIQREGKEEKKEKPKSETTVEVVTETNFSNGKTTAEGSTTRSATEPVSDSVSVTATESTTGEARTNSAALKVKEKASGLSATAGIKALDPADPQQATAAKGFIKVGGEWKPFPFLQLGVNNAVEFSSLKKAKYSLDGSVVLFPNGTLKPELAAKFLYDDKGASGGVDLGLNWDITKALSAKAGVKFTLNPQGHLESSGGLGLAFKFK